MNLQTFPQLLVLSFCERTIASDICNNQMSDIFNSIYKYFFNIANLLLAHVWCYMEQHVFTKSILYAHTPRLFKQCHLHPEFYSYPALIHETSLHTLCLVSLRVHCGSFLFTDSAQCLSSPIQVKYSSSVPHCPLLITLSWMYFTLSQFSLFFCVLLWTIIFCRKKTIISEHLEQSLPYGRFWLN
jgi:hypothetical protein